MAEADVEGVLAVSDARNRLRVWVQPHLRVDFDTLLAAFVASTGSVDHGAFVRYIAVKGLISTAVRDELLAMVAGPPDPDEESTTVMHWDSAVDPDASTAHLHRLTHPDRGPADRGPADLAVLLDKTTDEVADASTEAEDDEEDRGGYRALPEAATFDDGYLVTVPAEEVGPQGGRRVAIRRLAPGHAADPIAAGRLATEHVVYRQLCHPAIPVFLAPLGPTAFVRTSVPTRTLADALADPAVPTEALLEALATAIDAVAHAHAHTIAHRDLRLECIRIGDHGATWVVGWSQARPIEQGALVSIQEGDVDPTGAATDVRALGVALHAALTRHHPEPPPAWQPLLATATHVVASHRFPNAQALSDAVRALLRAGERSNDRSALGAVLGAYPLAVVAVLGAAALALGSVTVLAVAGWLR